MTAWLQPGDSYQLLRLLPDNSIDSLCSDPPYLLGFMGKKWDKLDGNPAQDPAFWAEVLRVLKPGAYGVAFGAPRTFHRLAVAMEDAGFEIRDSLHWVFGSGFPKSLNVSKELDKVAGFKRGSNYQPNGLNNTHGSGWGGGHTTEVDPPVTDLAKHWSGWGTALKPAHEPILLVRKPPFGSIAANVTEWGVGGVNVDWCRIDGEAVPMFHVGDMASGAIGGWSKRTGEQSDQGRWPPNVILTHSPECHETCAQMCPVALLDQVSGEAGKAGVAVLRNGGGNRIFDGERKDTNLVDGGYTDSGGVSRYFLRARYGAADWLGALYHGKAQKRERNAGVRGKRSAGEVTGGRAEGSAGLNNPRAGAGRGQGAANYHPTVKPVEVMRWLVRLVTPPGGVTLDPFLGSGTTAIAAALEGIHCVGFDLDPDHIRIAVERLKYRFESTADPQADPRQVSLWDEE